MANRMATREESHAVIMKLAALARIKVAAADMDKFTSEFDAILAYVDTISHIDTQFDTQLDTQKDNGLSGEVGKREKSPLYNVMREDGKPHAAGLYTEKIVAQFPAREGDALCVKQIISHG